MRAGELDTGLIGRDLADLTAAPEVKPSDLALAGAALTGLLHPAPLSGWRGWGIGRTHLELSRPTGPDSVEIIEASLWMDDGAIVLEGATGNARVAARRLGGTLWQVSDAAGIHRANLHQLPKGITLVRDGRRMRFALADPMAHAAEAGHGGDSIAAPLPGIVKSLNVAAGASVTAGDILAVMEAMKMEHSLAAPRDGVVAEVAVRVGEQVEEGALLITLEPAE